MARILNHPLTPLGLYSVALTALLAAHLVGGQAPTPRFEEFSMVGWGLLAICWMQADARRSARPPVFDFGFFMLLFFPASLAWYCLRSRRGWGLLWAPGIFAFWLVPHILLIVGLILRFILRH